MSLNTDVTVLDSLAATSLRATMLCLLDDISTGNASLLDKIRQKDAEIEQLVEKANKLEILCESLQKERPCIREEYNPVDVSVNEGDQSKFECFFCSKFHIKFRVTFCSYESHLYGCLGNTPIPTITAALYVHTCSLPNKLFVKCLVFDVNSYV